MARFQQYGRWGDQLDPVVLDDEDEELTDVAAQIQRQAAELAATWQGAASFERESRSPNPLDELEREDRFEESLEDGIAEVIDLTDDDIPLPVYSRRPTAFVSEEPTEISSYDLPNGLVLKPGMTVELHNDIGKYKIQFLRVKSIIVPGWGSEIVVCGFGFSRARDLEGMLPKKLNEVVLITELRSSGARGWEQALMEVDPSNIKCERELRMTNAPFPEHRFDPSLYASNGKEWVEENGPLVCRFRYEQFFHDASDKPFEWALVKIGQGDADPTYKMLDAQNLNRWRGGKVPGGSHTANGTSPPVYDLEESHESQRPHRLPGQRYTAGDVFAGAGGASRGIVRAGVKLIFAVDHWEHAARSLRSNFQDSRIHEREVTDFILDDSTTCRVDILHLSPPCQFWSPAHTVAGKNDESNVAVLFSCGDLIDKFRPRLFTVEQTFGILSPKFKDFFNAFLHDFTQLGYSVRWKVVPLANYGVPQLRKRLIMIGSAPGEKLPTFPPPTHHKDGAGGLKPWATPQSVLANLSRRYPNHKLHQPQHSKRFDPPKAPWDPTKLAKTITTNGGQNYHWSGKRDFTLLEYAILQGFPGGHQFRGRYIKKQIGNAFAPSVVKVLYEHLVRWLLVQDGFDPAVERHRAGSVRPPVNVISLDDSDDNDNDNGGHDGNARRYDVNHHDNDSDDDVIFSSPSSFTQSPNGSLRGNDGDNSSSPDSLTSPLGGGFPRANRAGYRKLRELVRRLDGATGTEAMDVMKLDGIDELSDTETVQDGEGGGGGRDVDKDVEMIDLTMDVGNGTADDPFVLSD